MRPSFALYLALGVGLALAAFTATREVSEVVGGPSATATAPLRNAVSIGRLAFAGSGTDREQRYARARAADSTPRDANPAAGPDGATRLTRTLRESDTVARFGDDEFVALLPDMTRPEAEQVARSLLRTISAPVAIDGEAATVGASIGISVFPTQTCPHRVADGRDVAGATVLSAAPVLPVAQPLVAHQGPKEVRRMSGYR